MILATDGDFNVGISDPARLREVIAEKRKSGVYLSVLGFGKGNLQDATMQSLAQAGNGNAAYIDSFQEARKVLVDELGGTLFPIADDVKVQIEFNPAYVAEYRLIGYETRMLRREDFNNDRIDAGEVGSGHTVTALYEIVAPNSPSRRVDPLRYGEEAPKERAGIANGELAWLRIRYKLPGATKSRLIVSITRSSKDPTFFLFPADGSTPFIPTGIVTTFVLLSQKAVGMSAYAPARYWPLRESWTIPSLGTTKGWKSLLTSRESNRNGSGVATSD